MPLFLYRHSVSYRQFISRPLRSKIQILQAEKSSPIPEINQTQVMEQQKSSLESIPEIKSFVDMEMQKGPIYPVRDDMFSKTVAR